MMQLRSAFYTSLTHIAKFGVYTPKSSYKADLIFKDYYSRRLTLSHSEIFQFFEQIIQHPFSDQDHRWISLTQNLQKNVEKFKIQNQVFIFKTLVDLQSKTQLNLKLKQALLKQINTLSFQQTAILLWCISKNFKKQELNQLSIIYKRICDILCLEKEESLQPKIIVKKKQQPNKNQTAQLGIKISASFLSMVLSSMANIGISDKKIIKRLIQNGIRDNLSDFSCTSLCTFLLAFQKLGLRNKRSTFEVYKTIRSQYKQLQKISIQTLLNLAICVSNLSKRDLSDQEKNRLELYPDQSSKQKAQLQDMRIFYGWICQTILLRQAQLPMSKAALILHYARKVQYFQKDMWLKACQIITGNILEAKIVDLVMSINAITSLNIQNRQFLHRQQETILNRLWQLQSSMSGKSLHTLAQLLKTKRIKPPPKVLKMLNEHLIQMQSLKNKTQTTKQGLRDQDNEHKKQEKLSTSSPKK